MKVRFIPGSISLNSGLDPKLNSSSAVLLFHVSPIPGVLISLDSIVLPARFGHVPAAYVTMQEDGITNLKPVTAISKHASQTRSIFL